MGNGFNIPVPPTGDKDAMEYSESQAGRRLEVAVQARRGAARQIRQRNPKGDGTERGNPNRIGPRSADEKSSWRVRQRPYRNPTQVGG